MRTTKYLQLPIPSKSDKGKIITDCLDPAFTKLDQKIESIDLKELDKLAIEDVINIIEKERMA